MFYFYFGVEETLSVHNPHLQLNKLDQISENFTSGDRIIALKLIFITNFMVVACECGDVGFRWTYFDLSHSRLS